MLSTRPDAWLARRFELLPRWLALLISGAMGLRQLGLGGALVSATALWMGACGSSAEPADCPEGDERCACYPNDSCNGDLVCRSDKCVSLDGSGGSGGSGGS